MNKIFYVKKTHIRTQYEYIIKQLIARTRWGNWVRVDMYVGLRLSCIEWRVSWRVTEQGSVRSLVIAFTFPKKIKSTFRLTCITDWFKAHTKTYSQKWKDGQKNMSEQAWTIVTNDIEESISSLCVYQNIFHYTQRDIPTSMHTAQPKVMEKSSSVICDVLEWCA